MSRFENEPVRLDAMHAHQGRCAFCPPDVGIVKMLRDDLGRLRPDACFCILCGQKYQMEIADVNEWEREQWNQKLAR